jgi:hypothetical protein
MNLSKLLACIVFASLPTTLLAQEEIDAHKSLVITDHRLLNEINSSLDFGYLLGDVGNWTRDNIPMAGGTKPWRIKWGAGDFIFNTLNGASIEQENHTQAKPVEKLGGNYDQDRTFKYIIEKWGGKNKLASLKNPKDIKNSPFRLLAIVNRMDLAGDMDDRGTTHTTSFPRSFGEIHLIYGFIDDGYEKKKTTYPATFVISYRLPIIRWQNGEIVEETKGGDLKELNKSYIDLINHSVRDHKSAWSYKMSLWASMWKSLSNKSMGPDKYKEKLNNILKLAIHPRNFLQLRSNIQINKDEFELREWYILMHTQALITRKPRDEAYKCQSGQPELTKIVNYFWNNHYNDLDMTSRSLHNRVLLGGKDGYVIPRDGGADDGVTGRDQSLLEKILLGPDDLGGRITKFTGCGDTLKGTAKFEMVSLGSDAVKGVRAVFVPPFARLKKNDVWEIGETPNREQKRHAFAVRTCSGCHGAEAGIFGFHVAPRLQNQDAKLSDFMTGGAANKFTKNRVTYKYHELNNRKNWLQKALDKNAVLFDSLKRNDR